MWTIALSFALPVAIISQLLYRVSHDLFTEATIFRTMSIAFAIDIILLLAIGATIAWKSEKFRVFRASLGGLFYSAVVLSFTLFGLVITNRIILTPESLLRSLVVIIIALFIGFLISGLGGFIMSLLPIKRTSPPKPGVLTVHHKHSKRKKKRTSY